MANKELQKAEKKPQTMQEYVSSLSSGIMSELDKRQKQGLTLPKNYAAQNALSAAIFKIKETVDKSKQPALSVCTPDSIKQAVMEMLVKGLAPSKTQCYFIVYGNKLTMFESYFGLLHRAKESDPNIKDIYGEVVYAKDKFKYRLRRGAKEIVEHEQEPENIDLKNIKGAYATILYRDGTEVSEYMAWAQIQNSWSKGQTKGDSDAHKLSPEEMAKRTVLKRLVKNVVNTSSDEELLKDIKDEADELEATEPIDITPDDEPEEEPEVEEDTYVDEKADSEPVADVQPKARVRTPSKTEAPQEAPEQAQSDDEEDWAQMEMPDLLK